MLVVPRGSVVPPGLRRRACRPHVLRHEVRPLAVQVADGDGQRVGGVVGRGHLGEAEEQLHHLLHLVFLGAAVADNGALDLRRGVLRAGVTGLDGREQCHAARVPELERATDVRRVEDALNRHALWTVFGQECGELLVDPEQLCRKAEARRRDDSAAGDEPMAAAIRLHASVAGTFGAGVDPEHLHKSEASISFSSMSKFDHACWTSSWSSRTSISFSTVSYTHLRAHETDSYL